MRGEETAAVCERLPKCPRCGMPSCPEVDEDDSDHEYLQCVSCLERWDGDYRVLQNAWKVANEYMPNAFHSDIYNDVASHVLAEHERARALFEDAGKPLPGWLLTARPYWKRA